MQFLLTTFENEIYIFFCNLSRIVIDFLYLYTIYTVCILVAYTYLNYITRLKGMLASRLAFLSCTFGLGVEFLPRSHACTEFACSPFAMWASSGYSGFLPQSNDMHCRLIGISKLSLVYDWCKCVYDCTLLWVCTPSRDILVP